MDVIFGLAGLAAFIFAVAVVRGFMWENAARRDWAKNFPGEPLP